MSCKTQLHPALRNIDPKERESLIPTRVLTQISNTLMLGALGFQFCFFFGFEV